MTAPAPAAPPAPDKVLLPPVGFVDAGRSYLKNFFRLSGRATRAEYWWMAVWGLAVNIPIAIAAVAVSVATASGWALLLIIPLALFWGIGGFTLTVRRFHDTGTRTWVAVTALCLYHSYTVLAVVAGLVTMFVISPESVVLADSADTMTDAELESGLNVDLAQLAALVFLGLLVAQLVSFAAAIWIFVVSVIGSKPDNQFGPQRAGWVTRDEVAA